MALIESDETEPGALSEATETEFFPPEAEQYQIVLNAVESLLVSPVKMTTRAAKLLDGARDEDDLSRPKSASICPSGGDPVQFSEDLIQLEEISELVQRIVDDIRTEI